MMSALILYGLVVSACVAVAALAAERIARLLRRPLRWIWAAALVTIVVLLSAVPLRRASHDDASTPGRAAVTVSTLPTFDLVSAANRRLPLVAGNILGVTWLVVSGALLVLLVGVHVRNRSLRGQWPVAQIEGSSVLVAPRDGPAVMGLLRPHIVVPRWLLDRPLAEQRIVVAHETQHLRAGDPVLLAVAWIVAAAMPWNAALWWIVSRLRLAVELDCDARVLGAGTPARAYGNLLIDVAAEHAGLGFAAPALLSPPSHLQRRLTAMYANSHRFTPLRGVAALAVCAAALLIACNAELPTSSEIEAMDAKEVVRTAQRFGAIGDSLVFRVDGKIVRADSAREIPASDIERVDVVRGNRGQKAEVHLYTLKGTAVEREGEMSIIAGKLEAVADKSLGDEKPGDPTKMSVKIVESAKLDLSVFQGLVFVDGQRVDPSIIGKLDRNSIASIEVVKGARARQTFQDPAAANGVISITTRK
jgi:beta-lactamase regulating signal transducer with metallopeptidase domain